MRAKRASSGFIFNLISCQKDFKAKKKFSNERKVHPQLHAANPLREGTSVATMSSQSRWFRESWFSAGVVRWVPFEPHGVRILSLFFILLIHVLLWSSRRRHLNSVLSVSSVVFSHSRLCVFCVLLRLLISCSRSAYLCASLRALREAPPSSPSLIINELID